MGRREGIGRGACPGGRVGLEDEALWPTRVKTHERDGFQDVERDVAIVIEAARKAFGRLVVIPAGEDA